jgi:hypothetical protein
MVSFKLAHNVKALGSRGGIEYTQMSNVTEANQQLKAKYKQ